MTDESVSQNLAENPDPQEKPVSGDDITPSQEQQTLPDKLPQSLIEWRRVGHTDVECVLQTKANRVQGNP